MHRPGIGPRGVASGYVTRVSWEESGRVISSGWVSTGRCRPFRDIFNAVSPSSSPIPLSLSLSFFSPLRLLVSSSTRLCSREYISMHFPGQLLARSLARSHSSLSSNARFNYQLFRVSQEFALAPPPPPESTLLSFLRSSFYPPLFLSFPSHGPHPRRSLWTSVHKVCACVQNIHCRDASLSISFPRIGRNVDFDSSIRERRVFFFFFFFPFPHDRRRYDCSTGLTGLFSPSAFPRNRGVQGERI